MTQSWNQTIAREAGCSYADRRAEFTYFVVMRRQLALSATARIRRAKIQVFAVELSHEVSAANRERLVRPLNAGGGKGRHGTDSRQSDHPRVPAWRQIKKAGGLPTNVTAEPRIVLSKT